VLPNGRVLFSSFNGNGPGKSLDILAVNIDGTALMGYLTGSEAPGNKEMVRFARDGHIYFIQSDLNRWLGGGSLACVSTRRPTNSYKIIASDKNGYYHSPCPLPDGGLVISYRGKNKNSHYNLIVLASRTMQKLLRGVQRGGFLEKSPSGRRRQTKNLYANNDYHCIDAQVLAPRPVVRGRSSFVDHNQTTGVFYCIDVYISDRPEIKNLAYGSIKQVRVLEGGLPGRVLGTAPVETDGSFHIRVPAETPLAFELLDNEGRVVCSQRSWTWAMPRESRGCIGCHENKELAAPNKFPRALAKPAVPVLSSEAAAKKGKR
jgi:hypothetical protein